MSSQLRSQVSTTVFQASQSQSVTVDSGKNTVRAVHTLPSKAETSKKAIFSQHTVDSGRHSSGSRLPTHGAKVAPSESAVYSHSRTCSTTEIRRNEALQRRFDGCLTGTTITGLAHVLTKEFSKAELSELLTAQAKPKSFRNSSKIDLVGDWCRCCFGSPFE